MTDQLMPAEMREAARDQAATLREVVVATWPGSVVAAAAEAGADALDRMAAEGEAALAGQIVTLAFEDGERALASFCNMEPCDCPEHEVAPPPRGTYVTIRLDDEDSPVGLWSVKVVRDVQS